MMTESTPSCSLLGSMLHKIHADVFLLFLAWGSVDAAQG